MVWKAKGLPEIVFFRIWFSLSMMDMVVEELVKGVELK
jgi:hypothetical protein